MCACILKIPVNNRVWRDHRKTAIPTMVEPIPEHPHRIANNNRFCAGGIFIGASTPSVPFAESQPTNAISGPCEIC